jgi:hypothetical protein
MKKIKAILISALIFPLFMLVASCDKTKDEVDELTEFDINYETEVPVPAGTYTPGTPLDIVSPEVPTESSGKFASEKTTRDLVSEIKLTKLKVSTNTGNLDFLQSFSIYIKASGLADVLVATKSNIPAGATSVNADLKDVNIKDHIFKDKIQFKVTVTFNAATTKNEQKLKMEETVHVKATLIH